MKRNVMFLSLFIAAFLFSSLGSVRTVKATTAEIDVCKASVKWNNKKDQVKNKHRRKYLGCLAEKLTMSLSPYELMDQYTRTPAYPPFNTTGCFPLARAAHSVGVGRTVAGQMAGKGNRATFADWGSLPRDSSRRWTIKCLEIQLIHIKRQPQIADCMSLVNWNDRLNQVKDGNRRKYLGCLAEKLTRIDRHMKGDSDQIPLDIIRHATRHVGKTRNDECFVSGITTVAGKDMQKSKTTAGKLVQALTPTSTILSSHFAGGDMHLSQDWGDVPPDGERRNTIACLEGALRGSYYSAY